MSAMSSSEDDVYDRQNSVGRGSYCLSADISESESCSSFSLLRSDGGAASTSALSSPGTAVKLDLPTPSFMFPSVVARDGSFWAENLHSERDHDDLSEVEMMKERFAKLLLGEDMSGGGKGVCSALAISNAITNLAASVFGELWKLEPLPIQKKKMWCREMEWLLSVNESIVELVPSVQEFPGGGTFEVMATRPRSDLYVNMPALKKLDAMLLSMLEGFKDTEFWYLDRDKDSGDPRIAMCSGRLSVRQEEKWWLPCPKVPPDGLSEEGRKSLQQCRDCTNQILKAAMAINSNVISEMEIPCAYMESLPKNGRDCLGEIIYRYITAEQFSPECLLDCLDLSSEHSVLEVANRIEAAIHVWRLKDERRHGSHRRSKRGSSWGGKVKGLVTDNEKNHALAHRAETLLRSLKIRFPVLPQTALDMTKIQFNKDVGQAILESYSRVMESLAFNIMARIDDLLFVDDATKQSNSESKFRREGFNGLPIQKRISPSPFSIHQSSFATPFATPSFCLTTATSVSGSPVRSPSSLTQLNLKSSDNASDTGKIQALSEEFERIWSHPGKLPSGDTPERD